MNNFENTFNQVDDQSSKRTLPWLLITKIIRYAYDFSSICTCVNTNRLRGVYNEHNRFVWDTRSKLENLEKIRDDGTCLRVTAHLQMEQRFKEEQLNRDDMCPIHQYIIDIKKRPSFNFVGDFPSNKYLGLVDDSNIRKLSLALVSKSLFNFVSTRLFTKIKIMPTIESQTHIQNPFCVIKRATHLSLLPLNRYGGGASILDYQDIQRFIKDVPSLCCDVEELIFKGQTFLDSETLLIITANLPNITCIHHHRKTDGTTINELFTNFTKVTSWDLSNVSINNSKSLDQLPLLIKSDSPIRKIILPNYYDWNLLDPAVKQNLEVLSFQEKKSYHLLLDLQDDHSSFPSLRHIILDGYYLKEWIDLKLPTTVVKVTLLSCRKKKSLLFFKENPQIKTIRFLNIFYQLDTFCNHSLQLDDISCLPFNEIQSSVENIIIHSPTSILESDVRQFQKNGYQFIGSTAARNSNFKLQFKRMEDSEYESLNQLIQPPCTFQVKNKKFYKDYCGSSSQNILPNFILFKIIGMVWNLRGSCTCCHNQSIKDRIKNDGIKLLDNQEFMKELENIKSNCAVHFSTKTAYHPGGFNSIHINRSRFQLSLLSKATFGFIQSNYFNTFIPPLESASMSVHLENNYCLLNHFTSLELFHDRPYESSLDYFLGKSLTITEISFNVIDILDKYSDTYNFYQKTAKSFIPLDIRYLENRGAYHIIDHQLSEQLKGKPIEKLYIHEDQRKSVYESLSDDTKMSMKSILINLNEDQDLVLLNLFPNVTQLHIDKSDIIQNIILPSKRIKKVIGYAYQKITSFLKINQSIVTFKTLFKSFNEIGYLESLVKDNDLVDAIHIRNLVFQISSTPSKNLLSNPYFQLNKTINS
ncbi:hypothetical protein DFA_06458 [Cavenderia fasciculata]|uniref:Uncharacterized protein n=1 Tax=Cavenderia fasciculata TaxID=261658 RepID=F4PJ22_CACFS|nr:uncharacterized protein DFA_06458 [Cavenderia fasciculata]EGG24308.1 hypothetical protein DFA_06458 [Cavenderia fasciculata]|eukprot:XP_004362159.1 hypothetical protein DFA_06458 [Cavenderia fasciculata]